MKKLFFFISVLLLFSGCKDKNRIDKDDLIGTYIIEDASYIDPSGSTEANIKEYLTWKLSLEENDNFEFNGHGETFTGYWAFAEGEDKKTRMLFQSGYMREGTIYAKFDKTKLLFEQPYSMFDSIFQKVVLKRIEK